VDPKASLDIAAEEKNLCPLQGIEPWVFQPMANLLYQLCHSGFAVLTLWYWNKICGFKEVGRECSDKQTCLLT
jgi:hypothetical protein